MPEQITTRDINELLQDVTKDKEGVNCIRLINDDPFGNNAVVCRRVQEVCCCSFGENLDADMVVTQVDGESYYYGASPKLSASLIHKAVADREVTNYPSFLDFLKKHSNLFCLHAGDESYMLPLFAKCVLTMACHFSIKLNVAKEAKESLKAVIAQNPDLFINGVTYCLNEQEIEFIGFISDALLDSLNGFALVGEQIEIGEPACKTFAEQLRESGLMEGQTRIRHKGMVYYSGVMPRALEVEICDDSFSADKVTSIVFIVERTTFAMVDALDNTVVDTHPYLQNHLDKIAALYKREDDAQQALYQSQDSLCGAVNSYLRCSPNTHTIAVSAFLETSDQYFLYGMRASSTIDSGECYCSANGQSEFQDQYVDLYASSAADDFPTMEYMSRYRIDFEQELAREVTAEMGNIALAGKWSYYGVCFLSINNPAGSRITKRRMHFNVLAKNKLQCDYETVAREQKKAVESFENNKIIGIQVNYYKSRAKLAIGQIGYLLNRIYNASDVIAGALAVLVFFSQAFAGGFEKRWSLEMVNNIATIVLALLLLVFTAVQAVHKYRKRHRYKDFLFRTNVVLAGGARKTLASSLEQTKERHNFHAIAYMMHLLLLAEQCNETDKPEV